MFTSRISVPTASAGATSRTFATTACSTVLRTRPRRSPASTHSSGTLRVTIRSASDRGLVSLHDIRSAWFDTGARTILDRYVKFESTAPSPTSLPPALPDEHEPSPQFTLMVKREGNHNFWHSLMEVFSMTQTFDTLRISRDPSTTSSGEPFFSFPRDAANTQVVLLDAQPNQPWFDLWRMFAGRAPVHLKDILADAIRAREFAHSRRNIILPLPGGSNPLWHNDWIVRSCRHAPLLRLFVRRVVAHAGLEFQTGPRPTSDDAAQAIRLTI